MGTSPADRLSARERILETAYDLFSRHGTHAVGVDAIVADSGVAKMSLYRNFGSKDELILAFLRRREELWTKDWLQGEVMRRADDPAGRLLAIFDIFGEWFARDDYEGCSFVNVMLGIGDLHHPVRRASVEHLATIREFLSGLAHEAGVEEPDGFARQWHILMKGSLVAAAEGDVQAAARAQELGRLLLSAALPAPVRPATS
ncbi:TetR/AcrR family transcriptional regulator [Candidatus Solirubrobacter pratensis]|uniref:TetR/AcrR family transcriptional regulator n=1 Tax=Candidatus Solirubrobacter pratensis TaxID=1298857 RepID=UPI000406D95C|nr:TetR/AcrR family transcriptional regulator [Candidatus Solirubrobacter pratensis]